MNRESAITEEFSYRVESCHVCGTEVGLDTRISDDEMVTPGYAVVLGEGDLSISDEKEGNWNTELDFAGAKSDSSPPAVHGYILCETCAEAVHDHSREKANYAGGLPDVLTTGTTIPNLPISEQALAAIIFALLLFIVILLL